jgi:hypothetical protein
MEGVEPPADTLTSSVLKNRLTLDAIRDADNMIRPGGAAGKHPGMFSILLPVGTATEVSRIRRSKPASAGKSREYR